MGKECTGWLLKFSLDPNDSNWHTSCPREIWIKCHHTNVQYLVYKAPTHKRGWYRVFSYKHLFPQHVYIVKNYTFHYNSRQLSDSRVCNCLIWDPYPCHNPQETLTCHCTPVINCYTQICMSCVNRTTGYIKLSTKCDTSRVATFISTQYSDTQL
jgi:hypothetical protein